MPKKLKNLLLYLVPYKFVQMWWAWRYNKFNQGIRVRDALNSGRLQRTSAAEDVTSDFSYEKAIDYLVTLETNGNPENREKITHNLREGSIPEVSLNFCRAYIESLYRGEPLLGLHIGNFVGVSLAFFTNLVKNLDPEAVVVSIDPNIQHRGIRNPINRVISILNKFNLQDNSMVLTGYSLEINPYIESSQSVDNLTSIFDEGLSCGQQLQRLQIIAAENFDFCVIDGNHTGSYLKREIEAIDRLLKCDGLLILDDVDPHWQEVQEIFETIDETKYQKVGADSRVGILRKLT